MGELLKHGGSGIVYLLEQSFIVARQEEVVPKKWSGGPKCDKQIITEALYITECCR